MLHWLPGPIKGIFIWSGLIIQSLTLCIPMYLFFILKYLLPFKGWRNFWTDRLHSIGENWMRCTLWLIKPFLKVHWDIQGLPELSRDKWYFIACNHQSWSDLLAIGTLFVGKVPFVKFFVKDELKYIPIIGLAWWAFECPVMKRYSKRTLEKHPELRGKDIETTLNTCQKYLRKPSSLLTFIEGTRFTEKKHHQQQSPFKHLLRPKPGGFALTVKAMEHHIKQCLHVTIVYPKGRESFWSMICGNTPWVKIHVEVLDIPPEFVATNYGEDETLREHIRTWLYEVWQRKDSLIERLQNG